MSEKNKRGGKRDGAGRKKTNRIQMVIRIDDDICTKVDRRLKDIKESGGKMTKSDLFCNALNFYFENGRGF